MTKSWKINRRSFLQGVGVACALPYLDVMAEDKPVNGAKPKRMAYVYIPNGVSLPEDPQYADYRWFPTGEGKDYKVTKTLEAMKPFRDDISILGGLSHPKSRNLLGHLAGDTWLTAGDLRGTSYLNNVSIDQLAAQAFKEHTRYPSFVFSTDGGIGYKSRVSTLSFDNNGKPIPSEHRHRTIFERYFSPQNGATTADRKRSLSMNQKIVDLVLEDSKSLRPNLGQQDKYKLDEYMHSLNRMEEQIKRSEAWFDVPLKDFDSSSLELDVYANMDPQSYIRSIFDLMVLGYQLDLTRVMTYMIAREDGMGFGENFPKFAIGSKQGHHTITHDLSTGHWKEWGDYDTWMITQFAYFMDKMKNTSDEHGSLLDNTQILYGSSCSTQHNANNCPLILAGGKNMGLEHGAYTVYDPKNTPLSNLFVKILNASGIETETFADSTEEPFKGIFA